MYQRYNNNKKGKKIYFNITKMTMDNPHLLENVHLALSDTFEAATEIYITRGTY